MLRNNVNKTRLCLIWLIHCRRIRLFDRWNKSFRIVAHLQSCEIEIVASLHIRCDNWHFQCRSWGGRQWRVFRRWIARERERERKRFDSFITINVNGDNSTREGITTVTHIFARQVPFDSFPVHNLLYIPCHRQCEAQSWLVIDFSRVIEMKIDFCYVYSDLVQNQKGLLCEGKKFEIDRSIFNNDVFQTD